MNCPNCNETLLITERHHVEIDYCPKCRGVWLDRGELDKILEYAANSVTGAAPPPPQANYPSQQYPYHSDDKYYKHGKPHKKKSFLNDFFDFD